MSEVASRDKRGKNTTVKKPVLTGDTKNHNSTTWDTKVSRNKPAAARRSRSSSSGSSDSKSTSSGSRSPSPSKTRRANEKRLKTVPSKPADKKQHAVPDAKLNDSSKILSESSTDNPPAIDITQTLNAKPTMSKSAISSDPPENSKTHDVQLDSRLTTDPRPFDRILVERLTRNITKAHIMEIFSVWGNVQSVDMPADRVHPEFSRSYAYITYEDPNSAANAINFMNGGQIDGEFVRVTEVFSHNRSRLLGENNTLAEKQSAFGRDSNREEKNISSFSSHRRGDHDVIDHHRDRDRHPTKHDTRMRENGHRRRERSRSLRYDRLRSKRGRSGSPFARSSRHVREKSHSPLPIGRYRKPSPPNNRSSFGGARKRSRSPVKNRPAVRPNNAGGKTSNSNVRKRGSASNSSSSSSESDSSDSSSSSSRSASSSSSSSSTRS